MVFYQNETSITGVTHERQSSEGAKTSLNDIREINWQNDTEFFKNSLSIQIHWPIKIYYHLSRRSWNTIITLLSTTSRGLSSLLRAPEWAPRNFIKIDWENVWFQRRVKSTIPCYASKLSYDSFNKQYYTVCGINLIVF